MGPEQPALSRVDNRTPVCFSCGTVEAMEQYVGTLLPMSAWHAASEFTGDVSELISHESRSR